MRSEVDLDQGRIYRLNELISSRPFELHFCAQTQQFITIFENLS